MDAYFYDWVNLGAEGSVLLRDLLRSKRRMRR